MGFSSSLYIGAALKVVGNKSEVFEVVGEALTYFGKDEDERLIFVSNFSDQESFTSDLDRFTKFSWEFDSDCVHLCIEEFESFLGADLAELKERCEEVEIVFGAFAYSS